MTITEKQLKIIGVVSFVLLTGGVLLYASAKNKATTTKNTNPLPTGNQLSIELAKDIPFIAAATGVDKELIKVGNSSFIIAWYNALKAGNETFSDNGVYFWTNSGQQFS